MDKPVHNGNLSDEELEESLGPGVDEDTEVEELEDDWDGPGDDEDDDEFREAGSNEAPWTPLPTHQARRMQEEDPNTAPSFEFPTVYEENRSEMLRDLGTAQSAKYITHRRAAEASASELGIEEYDYDEEQENIKSEQKAGVGVPELGQGDALAKALGFGGGQTGQTGAPRTEPPTQTVSLHPTGTPERQRDEPEPRRADLTGDAQAQFRRDMRSVESEIRSVASGLQQVREALATRTRLAEQNADGLPMDERLGKTEVLYLEDGGPKRCDRCPMWIKDKLRCTIHREGDVVTADMVCYLYVNGEPVTSESGAEPGGFVTPAESGLGQGNTSCGNCIFGNGAPRCNHPALKNFPIDNVGGCCNAWRSLDGKVRETVAKVAPATPDLLLRKLTENVGKLAQRPIIVQPPTVQVAAPRVVVHPPKIVVPRPEVINVPSPPHGRVIVSKEVAYNQQGLAVRVIETDDLGQRRRLRVKRGDTGQIIGLEPEE